MKRKLIFLTIVLSMIVTDCASQRVSVIESYVYDEDTDHTNYSVLPFGSVSIPGKWSKTSYNNVSFQQFFKNVESVEIAVAFNRYNKYEFNKRGTHKGMDFVEAFYEWDTKYFIDTYGFDREILEKDTVNKYMIYKVYGEYDREALLTYFLIGEKQGNVYNFSVSYTDLWDDTEKRAFLKDLFMQAP